MSPQLSPLLQLLAESHVTAGSVLPTSEVAALGLPALPSPHLTRLVVLQPRFTLVNGTPHT